MVKKQAGFGFIYLIPVVAMLIAAAGAGWIVHERHKNIPADIADQCEVGKPIPGKVYVLASENTGSDTIEDLVKKVKGSISRSVTDVGAYEINVPVGTENSAAAFLRSQSGIDQAFQQTQSCIGPADTL